MADKTVNINIKYNVDTSQVQKAETQSGRAQKATENLNKSTAQFGQTATKAGKEATNAFSNVKGSVEQTNNSFNDLVGTVKSVLAVLAVKEIANISLEIANMAGQVEGVTRAFQKLPNSTQLLNDLRNATKGTVSDLRLMQTAIKAENFKIPLNTLGSLLEFAAARAQQTGESVDYLVDSIITGIGRESPLILDNLQLRMQDLNNVMKETGVSLAEAVGVVAQQQLKEMGGLVETGTQKVDRLKSAWSNFLDEAATKFYSASGLGSVLDKLTNFLSGRDALSAANVNLDLLKKFDIPVPTVFETDPNLAKAQAELLKSQQTVLEGLIKEFDAGRISALGYQETMDRLIVLFKDDFQLSQIEATKVAQNFIKVQLQSQQASVALGAAQRAQLLEQIKKETFERKAEESSKKVADQIYRIKLGEDLAAQATKDFNASLEDLERRFVSIQGIAPSIEDSINELSESMKEQAEFIDFGTDSAARFRIKLREAFKGAKDELKNTGFDIVGDQIQATLQAEVDAYSARIDMARSFYSEQQELAGDNERAKKELRIKEQREIEELEKQRADRQKKATLAGIIVNTALSIAKTAAELGYPAALPFIAIAVAQGASQYAIASRARYYAKGKVNIDGPGTETSDSIPAFLSKGESVITAEKTRKSFGLLKAIEAGKIDDRILKKIDFSLNSSKFVMSDERIIELLSKIEQKRNPAPPDLVKQGRHIYEVYQDQQGNKRRIRSKSMG